MHTCTDCANRTDGVSGLSEGATSHRTSRYVKIDMIATSCSSFEEIYMFGVMSEGGWRSTWGPWMQRHQALNPEKKGGVACADRARLLPRVSESHRWRRVRAVRRPNDCEASAALGGPSNARGQW